MSGLFASGKVEKSKIKGDQDAIDEYERLRKEANFLKSSDICNEISNSLLLLLNIRGIFKNHENIVNDDRFRAVPLICLKETHTTKESGLFSLREHFNRYTFLIHNNTNKYKSLILLVSSDLFECIEFHEYDALIFATIKSKFSELYLTIALVYRKNNVRPLNFTQYLQ